jgi:hypothetical protein
MKTCYQFQNIDMLEHGKMVHQYYLQILNQLSTNQGNLKLPQILIDNKEAILSGLYPLHIMKEYHYFHDCGKPFCETIDDEGKKHFPNHAQVSSEIYTQYFKHDNSTLIKTLIEKDMFFHSSKMEEIEPWLEQEDKKIIYSLLLTSFAEIYANSSMFGIEGTQSTSFKIKYKKLDRISKKLF